MTLRFLLLPLALLAAAAVAQDDRTPAPPASDAAVLGSEDFAAAAQRFAIALAARRGLDPAWTSSVLGQARWLPAVRRLMQPSSTSAVKNWQVYRDHFLDSSRIDAGVRFWIENRAALARAEQAYGVLASVIVGILGVETIYGRNMGDFRVLDALATLAFDFPPAHPRAAARQSYFLGELENFLVLAANTGFDPLQRRGSYAGAMGMPQFMPGSQANYAVDFDGDGSIDLYGSAADAIGSVANYLNAHGWQRGVAPFFPMLFDPQRLDLATLLEPDILPTFSVDAFLAHGAILWGDALRYPGKLALVELRNGAAPPQYVAGTQNFYAITRYNQSSYYAMAVIELGRAVEAELDP